MMPADGPVPNLRFPEFRDAGPWEVKRLGDIANVVRGGSPRPISAYLTEDPTGLNWLQIGDLSDGGKYVLSTRQKIKQSGLPNTREVAPGNLILSNSMSFGRPYIAQIPVCVHDGWLVIDNDKNASLSEFLYYLLLSEPSQKYMRDAAAGGGVRNLNADLVKLLPAPLPSLPEQQKIADCLSSLDDLIRAEGARLGVLKDHKRALMQRLFPRPGETTPRLRFPDFRDAGPWEVRRLGEMGKFYRGLSYSPKDVSGRGLLVLRAGNIQDGRISLEADLVFVSKSCPEDILLQRGDIVICMSNGSKPLVGKSGELDSDLENEVTVGAFCSIFRPTNDFARFAFRTPRYGRFIEENIAGGSINNLKSSDLEKFEFYIPSVPDEQEKIADCLTALDELILAQGETIEALKTHKRGLMQKLFPREVG